MAKKKNNKRTRRPRGAARAKPLPKRNNNKISVSPAGREFLKCALAAPDFSVSAFAGVPDEYSGRVLTKRYETTASLGVYGSAGNDLYIMSSNCPGIAFFVLSRAAGSVGAGTWAAVEYPDTNSLLPQGAAATNVTSFRFASSQLEIVNLTNAMSWTGSIQVFRSYVHASSVNEPVTGAVGGTSLRLAIVGDQVINSVKPELVMPFNNGCYAVARNVEPDYPFRDVIPDMELADLYQLPTTLFQTASQSGVQFCGFGTMETIIYKIPAYSVTGNVGLIRAWACVEYQVDSSSVLYDYSHMSPAYDPIALALMREFTKVMPPGVTFADNASFWKAFLAWASTAANALAPVAGPYGGLLSSVGAVAAATSVLLK